MSFFPSLFAVVIVLAHCYLFWNIRKAFTPGRWQIPVGVLFAVFLAGGYFRSRIITLPHGPALVSLVFLWVGLLLLLLLFTAFRHAVNGAMWLARRSCARALAGRTAFRVALLLGALAFAYALWEARSIRIRRVVIKTDKLPPGRDRLRIAAIADLHLTRWTENARLEDVVRLANAQDPDILVLLGDTVDDWLADQERLRERLAASRARLGKFAINGNHERYRGLEQAENFVRASGFTLLKGEGAECGGIVVVGVDDPSIRSRVGIAEALNTANPDKYVVLLVHRPETPAAARGRFDLQLSGHTHGGQLWPARYLTWLDSGYWLGINIWPPSPEHPERAALLYLSNGTGYWGPPVRFLTFPEITVIDLEADDEGR